ncbi:DNA-methyltransferase [Cupriavidus nantongensis]|uniref:Methyltransferase n=1 Tax=Cupriavidus nantongensis TaxID=1796606 RepID=A0A142JGU3_9BURK|nr:site-specific DNA-methyltransferase [Cupriavidus nantongensis]AMR77305.1 DNA methylase N-4 [Cupriavidus nantongensis]
MPAKKHPKTLHLNALHKIDALELVRALPPASIDMFFTDPPYSSGGLHAGTRQQAPVSKYSAGKSVTYEDFDHDNMDQRSWVFWCTTWLSAAHRAARPGGYLVCFIDWRQLPALTDAVQAAGFTIRGVAVWDKTAGGARPRKGGFTQQAEFIVWASRGKMEAQAVYLPGVFPVRLHRDKIHLTVKPLELAREVVRLVRPEGTVCDLFAGSGTFLVAAKEAGLNWIGAELNPHYYLVATERLQATSPGDPTAGR